MFVKSNQVAFHININNFLCVNFTVILLKFQIVSRTSLLCVIMIIAFPYIFTKKTDDNEKTEKI